MSCRYLPVDIENSSNDDQRSINQVEKGFDECHFMPYTAIKVNGTN